MENIYQHRQKKIMQSQNIQVVLYVATVTITVVVITFLAIQFDDI